MRKMRNAMRWRVCLALLLAAACMTGCADGVGKSAERTNSAMTFDGGDWASDGVYEYSEEAAAYDLAEAPAAEKSSAAESKPGVKETGRKLITNMDMTVETLEYDKLMANVEQKVAELGGYIEQSNEWNGSYASGAMRSANLVLRIPAQSLDNFVTQLSERSNVTNKSRNVDDVTLTYVDLESHKSALKAEQKKLEELMQRAETMEDIITIEDKLTDVRYELESMESQLRSFDNQIDYSTLTLSINEVEKETPVIEPTTGERIADGFAESCESLMNSLKEMGINLIVYSPFWILTLFVLAIIGVIVWIVLRICLRPSKKGEKKAEKKADKKANKKAGKDAALTTDAVPENVAGTAEHAEAGSAAEAEAVAEPVVAAAAEPVAAEETPAENGQE